MAKGSHQYFSPPQGRGLFGKELVLCFRAKKKKKKIKVRFGLEYFIASKAASLVSGGGKGTQEPS